MTHEQKIEAAKSYLADVRRREERERLARGGSFQITADPKWEECVYEWLREMLPAAGVGYSIGELGGRYVMTRRSRTEVFLYALRHPVAFLAAYVRAYR